MILLFYQFFNIWNDYVFWLVQYSSSLILIIIPPCRYYYYHTHFTILKASKWWHNVIFLFIPVHYSVGNISQLPKLEKWQSLWIFSLPLTFLLSLINISCDVHPSNLSGISSLNSHCQYLFWSLPYHPFILHLKDFSNSCSFKIAV